MRNLVVFSLLAVCSFFHPILHAQMIPKAKLREDMAHLVKTIESVHPNPYHNISKERFYHLRDSIIRSFPDSQSVIDAWESFAFLTASLNEGHSDVRLPHELTVGLDNGSILLFPVLIRQFTDDGLLVRADLSPDSTLHQGDLLLSINNLSAAAIVERLTSTTGGLRSWKELMARQDFASQLFLHGIKAPYAIRYKHNGVNITKTLDGLTKEKMIAAIMALRKNNVTPATNAYSFSRIKDNVGYLDFRSMSTPYEAFSQFLNDTFASIKKNPVSGLIIDLRKNGGGNSALGFLLLHYITNKPFRMSAGSKWKMSEEYLQANGSRLKSASEKDGTIKKYLSLKAGEILSMNSKVEKQPRNPLRFEGKVCVLIGPNTFSSANMTANAIEDYDLATLIGEPTGEPANDFGELYSGELPNTKLAFVTSTKMFVRANGDATNNNPVLPDITVKQNPLSDTDDVFNFAIEWIRKK